MNRLWDRDIDVPRGDLPITDDLINEEDTDMTILCKCGYLICGDTLCPFCGRVYRKCEECGLYYPEDDLYDGICEECTEYILRVNEY